MNTLYEQQEDDTSSNFGALYEQQEDDAIMMCLMLHWQSWRVDYGYAIVYDIEEAMLRSSVVWYKEILGSSKNNLIWIVLKSTIVPSKNGTYFLSF